VSISALILEYEKGRTLNLTPFRIPPVSVTR